MRTAIDCFIANDEIELAQMRMNYLGDTVDHFVIGESEETFSGLPKDLWFSSHFSDNPRVKVIRIPPLPNGTPTTPRWIREEFQRDYLFHAVSAAFPGAAMSFCDVDEVPSVAQLNEMKMLLEVNPRLVIGLRTPTYLRRVNWAQNGDGAKWAKSKGVVTGFHQGGIRYKRPDILSKNAGAHLSYLGMDEEKISAKYAAFSHHELDRSSPDLESILKVCDEFLVSHTGLFEVKGFGLMTAIPKSRLGDVETAFACANPALMGSGPVPHGYIARLAASKWVTDRVRGENTPSFTSEALDFLDPCNPYKLKRLTHLVNLSGKVLFTENAKRLHGLAIRSRKLTRLLLAVNQRGSATNK